MGAATLALEKAAWSDAAAAHLARIKGDGCMAFYRAQVDAGDATLLRVTAEGRHIGTVVIRGEINYADNGEDLVIVAAAGEPEFSPEGGFISRVLPLVERLAREHQYTHVRAHTPRAGLVKRMEAMSYEVFETVMRREVRHGAHV